MTKTANKFANLTDAEIEARTHANLRRNDADYVELSELSAAHDCPGDRDPNAFCWCNDREIFVS